MSSIQSPTDVPLGVTAPTGTTPPSTTPSGAPVKQPLMSPGQYVQLNATTQDPRAPKPSPEEQGIGQVRQSFTRSDGPYYQVVWNPGDETPKSALYHGNQLTSITQQQANSIISSMASGSYTPNAGVPGSAFQQPNIPLAAAPPSAQQPGMETL